MNNFLNQKTPIEISKDIANRLRTKRKKLKISQAKLAQKSDVSLASIKRFESQYEISFISLIKLAVALDCESDFDLLFNRKTYNSIEEVINGQI